MERLYLDTNIYISLWLDEFDGLKYAGHYAKQLRELALECHYIFVVSHLTGNEIKRRHPFLADVWEEEKQILSEKGKIEIRGTSEPEHNEAKRLFLKHEKDGAHLADMTHLVMAMRHADVLVTRDRSLRNCAEGLIECAFPEELLCFP